MKKDRGKGQRGEGECWNSEPLSSISLQSKIVNRKSSIENPRSPIPARSRGRPCEYGGRSDGCWGTDLNAVLVEHRVQLVLKPGNLPLKVRKERRCLV